MVAAKKTEFISGKFYWAKILGEPVPNYERSAREWTLEFEPDDAGVAVIKSHKLEDRLKSKYEDEGRGKFLTLKKAEFNRDGNPNAPIRVYDAEDREWDRTKLIGNGSAGDIKLDIRDYGVGRKKGIYPVAIRVTELVPYQSSEFGGMDKQDAPVRKTTDKEEFNKDFGLDELNDEVPV